MPEVFSGIAATFDDHELFAMRAAVESMFKRCDTQFGKQELRKLSDKLEQLYLDALEKCPQCGGEAGVFPGRWCSVCYGMEFGG